MPDYLWARWQQQGSQQMGWKPELLNCPTRGSEVNRPLPLTNLDPSQNFAQVTQYISSHSFKVFIGGVPTFPWGLLKCTRHFIDREVLCEVRP